MKKLFGTDGIRGKAGTSPITKKEVFKLAYLFATISEYKRIALAWDTRESSLWIANAINSGLKKGGAKTLFLGCIPTPIAAYLIKTHFDGGIMITASHNPFEDNGLKFFNSEGEKISDQLEEEITNLFHTSDIPANYLEEIKESFLFDKEFVGNYLTHLETKIDFNAIKETYPLDCANGAASIFITYAKEKLKINFTTYNTNPNGKNINLNCGAANPEFIREESFALDGDGDRIMGKNGNGNIINGDIILMFLADALKIDKIVGTVMSNMALESFCKEKGIEFHRTKVGDRFVKEQLKEIGGKLGGEASGHIIFTELNSTGDGFAIYLKLLELMNKTEVNMDQLTQKYQLFPQKVINIKVKEKKPFEEIKGFEQVLTKCKRILGESGRIFPRYSGTESLLRILIETPSQNDLLKAEKILKEFFENMEE